MQAESAVRATYHGNPEYPAGGGLVISCEHGGNRIPEPYRDLFRPYRASLHSHRGFDAGSLPMARALASGFRCTLDGGHGQPPAGRSEPLGRAPAPAWRRDPQAARIA
jgi:predicted N-formylglutamate amidohydrolase